MNKELQNARWNSHASPFLKDLYESIVDRLSPPKHSEQIFEIIVPGTGHDACLIANKENFSRSRFQRAADSHFANKTETGYADK